MALQVYELRVRGPVPVEVLREIGARELGEEPPLTILRTEPTDQPGLHGMLLRLRTLGLELLEVSASLYEAPEEHADAVHRTAARGPAPPPRGKDADPSCPPPRSRPPKPAAAPLRTAHPHDREPGPGGLLPSSGGRRGDPAERRPPAERRRGLPG